MHVCKARVVVWALTGATKTPRSAMIEKAQMERNVGASGDAGHEQRASTEAFKKLLLQGLANPKVSFREDGRAGMPVITAWADERTQYKNSSCA